MVILMLWTTLALHIPTGPMMRALDNNFCYDYWWTNLLYINNFYPTTLNGEVKLYLFLVVLKLIKMSIYSFTLIYFSLAPPADVTFTLDFLLCNN